MPETKTSRVCVVCGKDISDKLKTARTCSKQCQNKDYKDRNKEALLEYQRQYNKTEEAKRISSEYRKIHRKTEKFKAYKKEESRISRAKRGKHDAHVKCYKQHLKQQLRNIELIKKNKQNKIKERCKFKRLGDRFSYIIRSSLKNNTQPNQFHLYVDWTIDEFRVHIERQFTKGMDWSKFFNGEIHIDHIIPQSTFRQSRRDEFKRCWSLTNLRPLWAKENARKSNKILFLL